MNDARAKLLKSLSEHDKLLTGLIAKQKLHNKILNVIFFVTAFCTIFLFILLAYKAFRP